jgi:hypothetical protein
VKKTTASENQTAAARKEIRANIRYELNTQQLKSKLDTGLVETMNSLLENENHPINKLFELGTDTSNPDHWRALTFIMVDEIFGAQGPGRPPKGQGAVKHHYILFYLNFIRDLSEEEGVKVGLEEACANLPILFKALANNDEFDEFDATVRRYAGLKARTYQKYAHEALSQCAALLTSNRDDINPTLITLYEKALSNFRPELQPPRAKQESQ